MKLYTTRQAAERLGIDESTVRRQCGKNGIGTKHGRSWVLTEDDLKKIVVRQPGWPKGKGNGRT